MKAQPVLFNVPKDSPSLKERTDVFKKATSIETHSMPGKSNDNYPKWLALHMPSARKVGCGITETDDLFECMAKACRILDEAGLTAYGDTEREAIRNLCDRLEIPCDL